MPQRTRDGGLVLTKRDIEVIISLTIITFLLRRALICLSVITRNQLEHAKQFELIIRELRKR